MTAPFALCPMMRRVSSKRPKRQRETMTRTHKDDEREPMSSDAPWL
jgi:hypothetical protein